MIISCKPNSFPTTQRAPNFIPDGQICRKLVSDFIIQSYYFPKDTRGCLNLFAKPLLHTRIAEPVPCPMLVKYQVNTGLVHTIPKHHATPCRSGINTAITSMLIPLPFLVLFGGLMRDDKGGDDGSNVGGIMGALHGQSKM